MRMTMIILTICLAACRGESQHGERSGAEGSAAVHGKPALPIDVQVQVAPDPGERNLFSGKLILVPASAMDQLVVRLEGESGLALESVTEKDLGALAAGAPVELPLRMRLATQPLYLHVMLDGRMRTQTQLRTVLVRIGEGSPALQKTGTRAEGDGLILLPAERR